MKRLILVLLIVGVCGHLADGETKPQTYFVQLIVGTNREKPEQDSRKIGPKLQRELSPVFQWTHYWEVSRQKIDVAEGKSARVRLTNVRELEIERLSQERLVVRLFRDGKLVRKMKDSLSNRRLIMGGDSSHDEAWFVVIRHDKPSSE